MAYRAKSITVTSTQNVTAGVPIWGTPVLIYTVPTGCTAKLAKYVVTLSSTAGAAVWYLKVNDTTATQTGAVLGGVSSAGGGVLLDDALYLGEGQTLSLAISYSANHTSGVVTWIHSVYVSFIEEYV